jgi:hypothetical protein
MKLSFPDPDKLFPDVLKYMYEGTIQITENNVIHLLSLANYLGIDDLRGRSKDFMASGITRSNVLLILRNALDLKTGLVISN